jgi:hypothetical protein
MTQPTVHCSIFKCKAQRHFLERQRKRAQAATDDALLDHHITWAEDLRTKAAKTNTQCTKRWAINLAHTINTRETPSLSRSSTNLTFALAATIKRAAQRCLHANKHVQFHTDKQLRFFYSNDVPMVTYDSGADGHYLSETDRRAASLLIIRPSTKRIGVANGSTSQGTHVTRLPVPKLSPQALQAISFTDFPHSLMSVGKTADNKMVSIFS